MSNMQASGQGGKGNFDISSLAGTTLSLEDYLNYAEAENEGDSYYYTITASLNLLPYGSTTSEDEDESTTTQPYTGLDQGTSTMRGSGNKFSFMVQGDFSITGYSSYDAMISLFGEDGSITLFQMVQMFDEESSDLVCVISDELAMYNELLVGDTITLVNPNNEDETYSLTISGIYTNSASSEGNQTFAMSDPANNIYMSYNALNSIILHLKLLKMLKLTTVLMKHLRH